MSKVKSIRKKQVEETIEAEEYMSHKEMEALSEDATSLKDISMEKLRRVKNLVQEEFNLSNKGFNLNGFTDKGASVSISMSNDDYGITINIKDADNKGLSASSTEE